MGRAVRVVCQSNFKGSGFIVGCTYVGEVGYDGVMRIRDNLKNGHVANFFCSPKGNGVYDAGFLCFRDVRFMDDAVQDKDDLAAAWSDLKRVCRAIISRAWRK